MEGDSKIATAMRSLIKAQEEQHQLNVVMLHSLTDLQRKIDSRQGMVKLEGSKVVAEEKEGLLVDHLN